MGERIDPRMLANLLTGCDLPDVISTKTGQAMKAALLELQELRALLRDPQRDTARVYQRPGVGEHRVIVHLGGIEHVVPKTFARELAASIIDLLRDEHR